jgi:hypothetical protein
VAVLHHFSILTVRLALIRLDHQVRAVQLLIQGKGMKKEKGKMTNQNEKRTKEDPEKDQVQKKP